MHIMCVKHICGTISFDIHLCSSFLLFFHPCSSHSALKSEEIFFVYLRIGQSNKSFLVLVKLFTIESNKCANEYT